MSDTAAVHPGEAGAELNWEKLARHFGHPTAVAVLELLAIVGDEGRSPKALARVLDAPLGQVAYHVRGLLDTGLIELVRTAPRRGAVEHFYRLTEAVRAR